MSDTWIVENKWNCSTCSTQNRGRDLRCSKCGKPKEDHEEYDLSGSTTAPKVTNPDELKVARGGANWSCSYCGSDARNIYNECNYCGGPKTEAAKKPVRKVVATKLKGMPEQIRKTVKTVEKSVIHPIAKPVSYHGNISKKVSWLKHEHKVTAIVCFSLVFFALLMYWLFAYHDQHVSVKTTSWTRTTEIQQRSTHHGSGWDQNRPSSHFNDVCVTRQHGTHSCDPYRCNPHQESYDCNPRSVPSGTTCRSNGNGYSTCSQNYRTVYSTCYRTAYDTCWHQCPTWDQWCEYDYYQWSTINQATNRGIDHDQSYPVLSYHDNNIGPQRALHSESYSVTFCDEDDSWTYSPDNSRDYDRFVRGHHWLIETNHAGILNPVRNEHH